MYSYPGRINSFGNLKVAFSGSVGATPMNSISFQSLVRKKPTFGVSSLHVMSQVRCDFLVGASTTIPSAAGARARIESNEKRILRIGRSFQAREGLMLGAENSVRAGMVFL
jgi:hypothetical protein